VQYLFNFVKNEDGLPLNISVHNAGKLEMHWHDDVEILLVLTGTIQIKLKDELFTLGENALFLVNSNETHGIMGTGEDNAVLAIKLKPDYFSAYYPKFTKITFPSHLLEGNEKCLNTIRYYLARILWELQKKGKGYQLRVGSVLHRLAAFLITNYKYSFVKRSGGVNKGIDRLQDIICYINENSERNVTLGEIAAREKMSIYYLSRYIKDKLGMIFQEYINMVRLDRALHLLASTDQTATEIAYASGFPSAKSFNKKFKDIYGCTPTEYRKENIELPSRIKNIKSAGFMEKRKTYSEAERNALLAKLFSYLDPSGEIAAAEDTIQM